MPTTRLTNTPLCPNQSITLSLQSIILTLQPITLTLQSSPPPFLLFPTVHHSHLAVLSSWMSIFGKQRCRCNGRLVNGLDPKSITRFEVFPPGSICDKVDIIVTMKSRKQICVNPISKMVKNILSGLTNVQKIKRNL
uniref:Chemokine interleukin-8-like domain-containing protein n=1 Tax=Leptobrachium leishanense TaxID=445787 RepID=A0A8C5PHS5_9ANUR